MTCLPALLEHITIVNGHYKGTAYDGLNVTVHISQRHFASRLLPVTSCLSLVTLTQLALARWNSHKAESNGRDSRIGHSRG